MADEQANEVVSAEYIVKPNGFIIPEDAAKVHGITTKFAGQNGVDLTTILNSLASTIASASVLIAHNIQFDEKILGAELLRAGLPNLVPTKQQKCTMQEATNYCRLPGPYGYKWPTLEELHVKLFNVPLTSAHRALADVHACARCYFELKRLKIMT